MVTALRLLILLRLILLLDQTQASFSTESPAIWETEPKENVDVDIYYEASGAIPLNVTHRNNELLIPLFSTFETRDENGNWHEDADGARQVYKITAVNQPSDQDLTKITISPALVGTLDHDQYIKIYKYDGSYSVLYVSKQQQILMLSAIKLLKL